MKLYATTTSERATKGQGGNKYLNIEILVGDKNNPVVLAQFTAEYKNDIDGLGSGYALFDHNSRENINWVLDDETKGKNQKGDILLNDETMKELTGETDSEYNRRCLKD